MKNNKVIVTGGLGFIGSNLIELLLRKNFFVINIDKLSYSSNFYNVKDFKKNKNYKFYKTNIGDTNKIYQILLKEKPIAIFNLAAETHVDRSIDDPSIFIENNVVATFNFLESFRKFVKIHKKIKLIHISTDEVYGDILKGRSKEIDPYQPSSPYAASKASSDHIVNSYIRTYKIPAIITNCSNNYGPKQHPEKLIPKLIYNSLYNLPFLIYGKGKNSREWIFVKDHCEALYQIFLKGKIGSSYNIGSGIDLTNLNVTSKLLKVAKKCIEIGPKTKIKFVNDRPGHDYRYALNSKKINKEIKWKFKTNFEQGIKITIDWYLNNKSYYKSFSKKDIIRRLGKL